MTEEDFAELGKQIWLMEQAARADDLARIVEADLRFHEIVIGASGQTHTVQIWRTIWPRIRAYFYRYGRGQDLGRMVTEHRELLAALQSRDPSGCAPCSSSTSPCEPSSPRPPRTAASARPARAGAGRQGPGMSDLLTVENLRTSFHTHGGVIRAVDGVDFSIARRDARRRRRVGERQVGDRALDHAARRPAGPGRAGLVDHVRGPRPREAPRGRDGEDPGQRDLDDLPGADDVAQPGVHRGRPDRRVRASPSGRRQEGGGRAGARDDAPRRDPVRRPDARLPPSRCPAACASAS